MATISKKGTGSEARYVVRYREPGGRSGKQRERTFRLRREADAFRVTIDAELHAGLYVPPKARQETFKAYALAWMDSKPHARATADVYERNLRNHVLPTFGTRPLNSITTTQIQAWVKGLKGKLAPSTIGTVYGIFASIIKAAVQDGVIARNPCVRIALPEVPKTDVIVLTPEQVAGLFDAMKPQYRALVAVGAMAGLRQGEAFGLCRDRVLFLERRLRVDQQVSYVTGKASAPELVARLKTPSSTRTVPLPRRLAEILASHVAQFGVEPSEPLFTSARSELVRRGSFNTSVWKPAVKASGIPSDTTFHDLRHTYASTALALSVPIHEVSRWLGHASITETVDTYGHLLPDADDRMREAMDTAFGAGAELVLTSALN